MPPRHPLSRGRIIDAALGLADRDGAAALSMRRLAKELGVEAMSLYNHVANKADILDGIVEQVYAEIEVVESAQPWPEQVKAMTLNMYRVLRRHPFVAQLLATDQANPRTATSLLPLENLLAVLAVAGFEGEAAWRVVSALNALTFGALMLSSVGFTGSVARLDASHAEPFRGLDPTVLPHFSQMLTSARGADPESDFIAGLDLFISGLVAAAPDHAAPHDQS